MFDLQAHILPTLDIGPRTFEEAITLARVLAAEGATTIIATPYFGEPYPMVEAAELHARARALQRMTRQAGVDARLYAGHLVCLDDAGEQALAKGRAATINDGPYAIVRLPEQWTPASIETRILRLRRVGVIPIIAHVERVATLRRRIETVESLIAAGALCQVTLSSLLDTAPPEVCKTAETLLTRNLAHVFGSGAHGALAGSPGVAAGLRVAELLVGGQRLREMTIEAPEAIVRGASVKIPTALAPARALTGGFWTKQECG